MTSRFVFSSQQPQSNTNAAFASPNRFVIPSQPRVNTILSQNNIRPQVTPNTMTMQTSPALQSVQNATVQFLNDPTSQLIQMTSLTGTGSSRNAANLRSRISNWSEYYIRLIQLIEQWNTVLFPNGVLDKNIALQAVNNIQLQNLKNLISKLIRINGNYTFAYQFHRLLIVALSNVLKDNGVLLTPMQQIANNEALQNLGQKNLDDVSFANLFGLPTTKYGPNQINLEKGWGTGLYDINNINSMTLFLEMAFGDGNYQLKPEQYLLLNRALLDMMKMLIPEQKKLRDHVAYEISGIVSPDNITDANLIQHDKNQLNSMIQQIPNINQFVLEGNEVRQKISTQVGQLQQVSNELVNNQKTLQNIIQNQVNCFNQGISQWLQQQRTLIDTSISALGQQMLTYAQNDQQKAEINARISTALGNIFVPSQVPDIVSTCIQQAIQESEDLNKLYHRYAMSVRELENTLSLVTNNK